MVTYDLCLTWNWEYDGGFVALLEEVCNSRDLSLWQVTPGNLGQSLDALAGQQVGFRVFFDRASEIDARFMPFVQWAREHGVYSINSYERASRTWDKALMHSALMEAGLVVPHTIILPAHEDQPDLPSVDLASMGDEFIIKPAHGSGGEGVMSRVTSWSQVLSGRREHAADRYLVQAHVAPKRLDSHAAWFRLIYCTGKVYPCWWDLQTHIYSPVTSEESIGYGLGPLQEMAAVLARVCGLELFSTEIALTSDDQFVVVDYVNDPVDLRMQSNAIDGIPDDIVRDIAERLASHVAMHR